ncbi:hypothetical protein Tco_0746488, partial [Tanacetum coccineum]
GVDGGRLVTTSPSAIMMDLIGELSSETSIHKSVPAPEDEFQSGVAGQNVGPSAENPGRTSVDKILGDRLMVAGGFRLSRRNLSAGGRHELSRNRTSEDVSLSKDVVCF